MSKISATKTESKEEIVYKYCYGKFIKTGTIESEDSKAKKKPSN